MKIAVILAGAVAKGSFEAGALDELTKSRKAQIVRVVGTSSGALNATVLAAGIHRGDPHGAAELLCDLWLNEGDLWHALALDMTEVLRARGVSDQDNLRKMLATHVKPHMAGRAGELPDLLHLVVATLNGRDGKVDPADPMNVATTYEGVRTFQGSAFTNEADLTEVFDAAVASASFPGLFAPSSVRGLGPCVDGGTVNNTPVKYALSSPGIDTVVVIAPTVQHLRTDLSKLSGVDLAGHITDMLVNERLYRDLREAHEVNVTLAKLQKLTPEVRQAALEALGWTGRKRIEILSVRPLEPLPGNAFSGFIHKEQRRQCIAIGRERAKASLRAIL